MSKGERIPLEKAVLLARELKNLLKPVTEKCKVCGSMRRQKEMIGDIDIVVIPKKNGGILKVLQNHNGIILTTITGKIIYGKIKINILNLIPNEMDFQIYTAIRENFGSCVLFFTGSKIFNINIGKSARKLGLKATQYGVFNRKTGAKIDGSGETEKGFFRALEMEYVKPINR